MESYRYGPSVDELPLATIPYPKSPTTPKPEWGTYPRNLPVTASICLDFSQPLPHLPGHPALVLAPASTWHPSIGLAMALLGSARAEEVGASILWCDGGSGAVNGVYGAGRGMGLNVEQVGNGGSWLVNFGVPYDGGKQPSRTQYAILGWYSTLLASLALAGGGWAVETAVKRRRIDPSQIPWGAAPAAVAAAVGGPLRVISISRLWRKVGGSGERAPLLGPPTGNLLD